MQKMTVYVPDELKAELKRTAVQTRRSEADLVREGIRLAVARHRRPVDRVDLPNGEEALTDQESRRLAMREQYLPENEAPAEERESWRRIARAAALLLHPLPPAHRRH